MKLNKKGFTIVELVIVIAVIAILAAVLIPTFNSVISKANESAALQEAKAAESIVILEENGSVNDAVYYYVVFDKATTDGTAKPEYVFIYDANKPEDIFKNVSDQYIDDADKLKGDLTNAVKANSFLQNDGTNKADGTNADLSTKLLVFKVDEVVDQKDTTKTVKCFITGAGDEVYTSDGTTKNVK